MRAVIAERMAKSFREAPHFYLTMEIDMTRSCRFREDMKKRFNPGYNDMIIRASALALREFPDVNSIWLGRSIERRSSADIGLAVSLDDGLMVPVVRGADAKSLETISKETAGLIEKARSNRLTPDEYGNASMTVSNLGAAGIESFMPIVNLGESVILGIGRIAEKPSVLDGVIVIRKLMTATLSCDHRVVDGALGARFLAKIRDLLENPEQL
jgi:pyruvate dehydrogenase E2 component (dihydrolipoamide acetyltransferase)